MASLVRPSALRGASRIASSITSQTQSTSHVRQTQASAQFRYPATRCFHKELRPIIEHGAGLSSSRLLHEKRRAQKSLDHNGRETLGISMRTFSKTAITARDHHFDTLKFVQKLKEEGFTEEQAVSMMKILSDVIEESILNLTRTMVLREDQEKATYTQKVDFAKLRSELVAADASESSLTRASHDRVGNEITKLNTRLRDEVQRTLASVRLDLNLEKGRIREEANAQDMKIKETETRIEQEVAALKERLETVKFQTLQWLFGVCTGTAALILATWRLLM